MPTYRPEKGPPDPASGLHDDRAGHASPAHFEEVHPESPEAMWCLEQYYAELRHLFEEGFDVSRSSVSDAGDFVRPRGIFLVARVGDRTAGCGGLKLTSQDVAYVKRMWIDSTHRGLGLGRALLSALERAAIDLGCRTVQLETNRALTGAIRLYERSGYREVSPFNSEFYAHHWFEKPLATGERPPAHL